MTVTFEELKAAVRRFFETPCRCDDESFEGFCPQADEEAKLHELHSRVETEETA